MRRAMLQLLGLSPMMGTGDGLRRPVNAPNAAPITPGVQPGNQPGVINARQVITAGPGGGVFVYDPKVVNGDLIASITDALRSPTGDTTVKGVNAYVSAGGKRYAVGLNQLGTGGLPGVSIADTANAPFASAGFYGSSSASAIADATVFSGKATGSDVAAQFSLSSQQSIGTVNGFAQIAAGFLNFGNNNTVNVDDNNTAVAIAGSNAAHSALTVTSTAVSPANLISIMAPAAGNNALGILVTGDTSARLKADTNGKLQWGPGNAAQDTDLQRSAPGVLQATRDIVGTVPAGTAAETWHPMTLLNGWANSAGNVTAQYRRIASPPNSVEIIGTINATAATSTTFATLPAGYIPASQQQFAAGATGGVVAGTATFIQCDTAGNLTLQHGTIGVNNTYVFHGTISLDA